MARPQRNNVDYFPLYVDNGRKMFFIEQKYGNDGYAAWLKILSELGKADYHYLNLKDDTQLMYLSALCRIDLDTLNNIINDLVRLGEFNKIFWSEKILFSEKFVSSIEDAYNKRSNNPPTLQSLELLLKGLGVLKQGFSISKGDVKPQRKVKDSKEEETIIPEYSEFCDYSKEICKKYNYQFVGIKCRQKYDYWKELGWKDGNGNKIKNWKAKLINSLKYTFDEQPRFTR
jgi:hypothetical protein